MKRSDSLPCDSRCCTGRSPSRVLRCTANMAQPPCSSRDDCWPGVGGGGAAQGDPGGFCPTGKLGSACEESAEGSEVGLRWPSLGAHSWPFQGLCCVYVGALAKQSSCRARVPLPWNHSETHGLPFFFSVSCFRKLRAKLYLLISAHLSRVLECLANHWKERDPTARLMPA